MDRRRQIPADQMKWWFCGHADGRHEIVASVEFPKMLYDGGTITSRSYAYESEQELREGEGIGDSCSICGQMYSTKYCEPIHSQMIAENICFSCHFWMKQIPKDGVIIAGRHYTIGPEPKKGQPTSFLGMAGREFHIRRNTGEVIVTHNLWSQGEIPERFRDRFPDNAEFLNGAGFVKIGEHGGAWDSSRGDVCA